MHHKTVQPTIDILKWLSKINLKATIDATSIAGLHGCYISFM